jgi:hypothetical protein
MFSRRFLPWLTYGLAKDSRLAVAEIPGQLNTQPLMQNGFKAGFQSIGKNIGDKSVRFFFPWAPLPNGSRFEQIIPNQPPGALCDDVGRFWETPGDEDSFAFRFVKVSGEDAGFAEQQTGILDKEISEHQPLIRELRGRYPPRLTQTAAPLDFTFLHVTERFVSRMNALGYPPVPTDLKRVIWLTEKVKKMNGGLGGGEMNCLAEIVRAGSPLPREQCMKLLKSIRSEIVREQGTVLEGLSSPAVSAPES